MVQQKYTLKNKKDVTTFFIENERITNLKINENLVFDELYVSCRGIDWETYIPTVKKINEIDQGIEIFSEYLIDKTILKVEFKILLDNSLLLCYAKINTDKVIVLNRIGICLVVNKQTLNNLKIDSKIISESFFNQIHPFPIFKDLKTIELESVKIDLSKSKICECEDQRNWLDSSIKFYGKKIEEGPVTLSNSFKQNELVQIEIKKSKKTKRQNKLDIDLLKRPCGLPKIGIEIDSIDQLDKTLLSISDKLIFNIDLQNSSGFAHLFKTIEERKKKVDVMLVINYSDQQTLKERLVDILKELKKYRVGNLEITLFDKEKKTSSCTILELIPNDYKNQFDIIHGSNSHYLFINRNKSIFNNYSKMFFSPSFQVHSLSNFSFKQNLFCLNDILKDFKKKFTYSDLQLIGLRPFRKDYNYFPEREELINLDGKLLTIWIMLQILIASIYSIRVISFYTINLQKYLNKQEIKFIKILCKADLLLQLSIDNDEISFVIKKGCIIYEFVMDLETRNINFEKKC